MSRRSSSEEEIKRRAKEKLKIEYFNEIRQTASDMKTLENFIENEKTIIDNIKTSIENVKTNLEYLKLKKKEHESRRQDYEDQRQNFGKEFKSIRENQSSNRAARLTVNKMIEDWRAGGAKKGRTGLGGYKKIKKKIITKKKLQDN